MLGIEEIDRDVNCSENWISSYWVYKKEVIDPAVDPVGIFPNEVKTYQHTETCTWMFTAALFIITNQGSNQDGLQQVSG